MAGGVDKSGGKHLFEKLDQMPKKEGGQEEESGVKKATGLFSRVSGKKVEYQGKTYYVDKSSWDEFVSRNLSADEAIKAAFEMKSRSGMLEDVVRKKTAGPNLFVSGDSVAEKKYSGDFLTFFREKGQKEILNAIKIIPNQYIDCKDAHDNRLLELAISYGYRDVVKYLIQNGADVNQTRLRDGYTPLHFYASNKDQAMVKFLVSNKVNIDVHGEDGNTPLHVAVKRGDQAMVRLLLSNKADIDAQGKDGNTPLHVAVKNGDQDMVKLLLSKGARVSPVDKNDDNALHVAVKKKDMDMVKLLLPSCSIDVVNHEARDQSTDKLHTPIYSALQKEDKEIIKILLSKGAVVSYDDIDSGLLSKAYSIGSVELVKHLLTKKRDLDVFDHLRNAIDDRNEKMTDLFFSVWAKKNLLLSQNPAHVAMKNDMIKMLVALMTQKDTNAGNIKQKMMDKAIEDRNEKVVRFLMHSVDINEQDKATGDTRLHRAVRDGDVDQAEFLIRVGANIDLANNDGKSPRALADKLEDQGAYGRMAEMIIKAIQNRPKEKDEY